ncbi:MAG: hypothetical protein CM15mP22_6230 [Gammaproteobacteria bacterium]|nr:MAG: hypothetical protein CM15mP22_6230 [Gammaproteobacteria bacterium]
MVDNAVNQGFDVYLDQYPYTASQTSLRALIPQWAQAGGREMLLQRIEDPEIRAKLKKKLLKGFYLIVEVAILKCCNFEAKWDTSLKEKSCRNYNFLWPLNLLLKMPQKPSLRFTNKGMLEQYFMPK